MTQLELALRQKEQRIQLLNARLAELQEQLKAQQETKSQHARLREDSHKFTLKAALIFKG